MMDEPWPLLRDLSTALMLLLLAGVALAPSTIRWRSAPATVTQPVDQRTDPSAARAAGPVPVRTVTGTARG